MTLDDLRKLCAEATPGPWSTPEDCINEGVDPCAPRNDAPLVSPDACIITDPCCCGAVFTRAADPRFIAAARSAMPLLIEIAQAAYDFDFVRTMEQMAPGEFTALLANDGVRKARARLIDAFKALAELK